MSDFVHLHLHSEYSLLDGACRIKDIPLRAVECGHNAVAITDHGAMFGAVAFYLECKKHGIKPIIGCEVYVAHKSRYERNSSHGGSSPYHLVLLCKNEIGYKNLIYLVSKGYTEGFYNKPRIDFELLKLHSDGLIALSACLSGRIPRLLSSGDYNGAVEMANELSTIFGKDNFYIELQYHGMDEQKRIIPLLVKLASECRLPLVATNDCHYLRKKDYFTQTVLMCIQTNSTTNDNKIHGFKTNEFYYKTTDEMNALFGKYENAIENTVKIAERCNFDFNFDNIILPAFKCPNNMKSDDYLRALTYEGFDQRIKENTPNCSNSINIEKHTKKTYLERLEFELNVISNMGYSDYFLIVSDYVRYAKSQNIPVGPGRGSGAGSLVAFSLGITDIDPISFDLLFERFLNPERVSMPDIDIDFCYNRREEVIAYVAEKYGREHVSQIITFGTLAAKASIRDTGRALGMAYSEVNACANAIPRGLNVTLDDAMKTNDFKRIYEGSQKIKKLVDTAYALEGMPRNVSIHAAGVVITDDEVSSYVPMAVSSGSVITQYDMNTVAHLGLLKFDFLALRYLTIIENTRAQINEKNSLFNIEKIPLNDVDTYSLIAKGNTLGVFQLESSGIRQMLMSLKPENIDDVIAAISLYRPGPMDSIPRYVECRHNPALIKYDIDELEPILKPTYGCLVYQEQVLKILRELAGFTYGHADLVRRAMSKKKASVIEAERENFLCGTDKKGIDHVKAEKLFEDISGFANYAYNKSHAAAYAVISYRTAYLKAHYPEEYYAALLTSVLENLPKLAVYISECSKKSIKVSPPDINESNMYFHVVNGKILYGLLAIKNVGRQFVEAIISERSKSLFSSFENFIARMSAYDINKKQIETLIKSGAFDTFGVYRSRLLASCDMIFELEANKNKAKNDNQLDMFTNSEASDSENSAKTGTLFAYPDIPEFSLREKLMLEKEATGMYLSGHMIDNYNRNIEFLGAQQIAQVIEMFGDADKNDDEVIAYTTENAAESRFTPRSSNSQLNVSVKISGIISAVSKKSTKNNDKMAFFSLTDRSGEIECIIFPNQYRRFSQHIHVDLPVCIDGVISENDSETPKIIVNQVMELVSNKDFKSNDKHKSSNNSFRTEQNTYSPHPQSLYLRVPSLNSELFQKVDNIAEIFEGATPLFYFVIEKKTYIKKNIGINLTDFVINELIDLLGQENVVIK